MRTLASFIGFLQKLRIYSHESALEWFRFISHKKKVFMEHEHKLGEQFNPVEGRVRPGVDFVVNGRVI